MSKRVIAALVALLLLGLLLAGVALRQAQDTALAAIAGNYELAWWTVDGGGGTSSTSGYTLSGTIGQPGIGTMSNGSYVLAGSFQPGAAATPKYKLSLPLVVRQHS